MLSVQRKRERGHRQELEIRRESAIRPFPGFGPLCEKKKKKKKKKHRLSFKKKQNHTTKKKKKNTRKKKKKKKKQNIINKIKK
eukprot:NODE_10441_length_1351_cov_53.395425.p7 GENE.NODE_10441_length_1351_cov_53.395425~~NODE_10441_length_1351_cov_53.395425.p7  ORF type:complete len:83 (+),score=48.38 NODE_10441_length_1351_cov_53.395425:1087-1335(+)